MIAAVVVDANAAGQHFDLQTDDAPLRGLDVPAAEPDGFWPRFKFAFDQNVDDVFADQFHPLSTQEWSILHSASSGNKFLNHESHTAQRAFVSTVEYSLREATVGMPVVWWLQSRQELLGDFVADSVNAVDEEAVSPLDPVYRPAERSWWNGLAGKSLLRYGIRPFRTDPYAFLGFGIRDGQRLLLLGHVRYYFQDLADHRFELAFSLPLPDGCAIDLGTSYQFGFHDTEKKLVLKFVKQLKCGGIVHVGFVAQREPVLFAGLSVPW